MDRITFDAGYSTRKIVEQPAYDPEYDQEWQNDVSFPFFALWHCWYVSGVLTYKILPEFGCV